MVVSFGSLEIETSNDDGTTGMQNLDSADLFEVKTAARIKADVELPEGFQIKNLIAFPFEKTVYVVVEQNLYALRIESAVHNVFDNVLLPDFVSDYVITPTFVLLVLKNGTLLCLNSDGLMDKSFNLPYREGVEYKIEWYETNGCAYFVAMAMCNNTADMAVYEVFDKDDLFDQMIQVASFSNLAAGHLVVTVQGICVIPNVRSNVAAFLSAQELEYEDPTLAYIPMDDRMPADEAHTFSNMLALRYDGYIYLNSSFPQIIPSVEIDLYKLHASVQEFEILNHEGCRMNLRDKLVLHLRDDDGDCKLYYTNLLGDFSYGVDVPDVVAICSEMTISTDFEDNVVFVEGNSMKSPNGARMRLIFENTPQCRLQNLLDKERFEDAMVWAQNYGMDTSVVIIRQVEHEIRLMTQFGTKDEDIDKFIALLSALPDEQSFDYAYEVMILARTYENIEKMWNFCSERQVKDEDLIKQVHSFKYAVNTYCAVYEPNADFSKSIWKVFCTKENHWELFKQLLEQGKVDRARYLWQRYQETMDQNLQNRLDEFKDLLKLLEQIIRNDFANVNEVILLLEKEILSSFATAGTLPSLSQYSDSLLAFAKLIVNVLETHSNEYPFNACFVVKTIHTFFIRIAKDIESADGNRNILPVQLAELGVGALTENFFTELSILCDRLSTLCHMREKYNLKCSLADLESSTLDDLALKMLSTFGFGLVDNLQVYVQTVIIPFCEEYRLDKDEIFLKYVVSKPGNLQACLVLCDMINDSDLCARTTMSMMKSCPLTNIGWPLVLEKQVEKVMGRALSHSIRNGLKSLLLKKEICMLVESYSLLLPRKTISDISESRNLAAFCLDVINSSHSTMGNRFEDVIKLHRLAQADKKLCFDYETFCSLVVDKCLIKEKVDYTFIDDYLRCFKDAKFRKSLLLPIVTAQVELMGTLPAEHLKDCVRNALFLFKYLEPNDKDRVELEKKMLVMHNVHSAFSIQVTKDKIGNFEAMESELLDAILDAENDMTFSGYYKLCDMLLLDMNRCIGLLFRDDVVKEIIEVEELRLKFQNMACELFNTKFVLADEPTSMINGIYVYLSLFSQRVINLHDVPLLVEKMKHLITFIELQVSSVNNCALHAWSTLLKYVHLVSSVAAALIPERTIDELDEALKSATNREMETCGRIFERERVTDAKTLQLILKLAVTVNNDTFEDARLGLWKDILMNLLSNLCYEISLKAFALSEEKAFLTNATVLHDLYPRLLAIYLEKLITHDGEEFIGRTTALLLCRNAPNPKDAEAMLGEMFKRFYQKQQRTSAYRVIELKMKLGFMNVDDAQKQMNAILCIDELARVGVSLSSRYIMSGPACALEQLVSQLVPPRVIITWCKLFNIDAFESLKTYLLRLIEKSVSEEQQDKRTSTVAQVLDELNSLGDFTKHMGDLLNRMLRSVNPYDYELLETVLKKCTLISTDEAVTAVFSKHLSYIKFLKSESRQQLIGDTEIEWLKVRNFDGYLQYSSSKSRLPYQIFVSDQVTDTIKSFLLYELSTERLTAWETMAEKCAPLVPFSLPTVQRSVIVADLVRCCQLQQTDTAAMFMAKNLLTNSEYADKYLNTISCVLKEIKNSSVRSEILRFLYDAIFNMLSDKKKQMGSKSTQDPFFKSLGQALGLIRAITHGCEMHTYLKKYNFICPATESLVDKPKEACTYVIDELTDWDSWDSIATTFEFLTDVSSRRLIHMKLFLREYLNSQTNHNQASETKDDMSTCDLNMSAAMMDAAADDLNQSGSPYLDKEVTKLAMIVSMVKDEKELVEDLNKNMASPGQQVKWMCVLLRASLMMDVDIKNDVSERLRAAIQETLNSSDERSKRFNFITY
ncbi:unnamed protein product [Bursaphelenchus okinawaensis]|uniref:RZZ complex subunit KNTC1/ROD C-terminal domain-containing protein n=1 Tax=Bursaphelenchus okinawaensis TaxID=465554 RepID=A0A811LCI7_9BILA|nr:unnamed protein product [Bursaphelenchus okinawaensis]CAG9120601.1 unnamed protein product [Bursaphelenchus okinawaensis]